MYSFKNTYKPLEAVFPRRFLLFYKTKSANRYQFGFNGQLKDNEIYGEGNAYDYGDREYDPRSIRRWNVDIVKRANKSPYQAFANNPICYSDPSGALEGDYWRYNEDDKKLEHVGNDGIDDGLNFILKTGGIPNKMDDENYMYYPTQEERGFIGQVVNDFKKDYTKDAKIEGKNVRGTFREIGGITSGSEILAKSHPGQEVIPARLDGTNTLSVNSFNLALPPGTENPFASNIIPTVIFHLHASASAATDPFATNTTSYSRGKLSQVWKQDPSPADYENAQESYYLMMTQRSVQGMTIGVVLQIATEGSGMVNFIDKTQNSPALQLPLNIFTAPLPKKE